MLIPMSARFATMLSAVTVLTACAGVERAGGPPMEPGRYTFDGSGQVTHHYHDRQENSVVHISGVMDVNANGDVAIMGSGANCSRSGTGMPPARVSMRCGALDISLGPGAGTARVRTQQIYEQPGACEEYEVDSQGRPTSRCLRQGWRERRRSVQLTIPLSVVRTSGAL
ncbi:MAG TPA: hypothetical protein VK929_14305 [Longimicrobiales bacterium]|nr:hypothetical protein [Longimicrobiales bacterium]